MDFMEKRNIIVIGASSGGLEVIRTIIGGLPEDFDASIFIVWHMSPDLDGFLPQMLNRISRIPAANAVDGEAIVPNRIYLAPPDRHMLVEKGCVRLTHGPKENRFRPAIDPLFRSAAYAFTNRVIGIVLSGALDDGTAGLWAVRQHRGIAVVQDPADAEVPSMPQSALDQVRVDFCKPASEIASLLVQLAAQVPPPIQVVKDERTKKEIEIAAGENPMEMGTMDFGALTPFTCPECHGVLVQLQNDQIVRYRCHTGHAYSVDALVASVTERVEESLYSAIRGMDESEMLLNHIGDHLSEANQPKRAAFYFKKAREVQARSELVRRAVAEHEQLTANFSKKESENQTAGKK